MHYGNLLSIIITTNERHRQFDRVSCRSDLGAYEIPFKYPCKYLRKTITLRILDTNYDSMHSA